MFQRVESVTNISAPVYNKEGGKLTYTPEGPTQPHPGRIMVGPKLPVLSANQYNVIEAKFEGEKVMAPPAYRQDRK